jgi:hypothetical protein
MPFRLTICLASVLLIGTSLNAGVIDFSDQSLPANSYDNGASHAAGFSGFSSGGAFFNNSYDSTYQSWTGWSLSTVNNTGSDYGPPQNVPDYGGNHEYASASGSGNNGMNSVYAVGYYDGYDPTYINLASGQHPVSVYLNNTTYDALSMENGDGFAKKFGPTDFFTATLTGYSGAGETGTVTGSVDFPLAANGNIVTDWTLVDLTNLADASSIGITFESSDTGEYGINTPTFVALDDLSVVPEPTGGILLVLAGGYLLLRARNRPKGFAHEAMPIKA